MKNLFTERNLNLALLGGVILQDSYMARASEKPYIALQIAVNILGLAQ